MRLFLLTAVGVLLVGWGLWTWAGLGYPLNWNSFNGLNGIKKLDKDSPIFAIGLGALFVCYVALEILVKRKSK